MKNSSFFAPFLKQIKISQATDKQNKDYPFSIPALASTLKIGFDRRVTFFVGENGSGKSTILEAIALQCGFNVQGGNRNHIYAEGDTEERNPLSDFVQLSWLPRVTSGFFLRAESFFNFASYLDVLARQFPSSYNSYGGQSLHEQSHGEAFLSLFKNRF
ncbi:MAG: AAA family ATPase, partial [Candidatus Vogelbacteria bacterium]|nr:AAA family ATPase [Candidatus Vogelbacteria bacterium]